MPSRCLFYEYFHCFFTFMQSRHQEKIQVPQLYVFKRATTLITRSHRFPVEPTLLLYQLIFSHFSSNPLPWVAHETCTRWTLVLEIFLYLPTFYFFLCNTCFLYDGFNSSPSSYLSIWFLIFSFACSASYALNSPHLLSSLGVPTILAVFFRIVSNSLLYLSEEPFLF